MPLELKNPKPLPSYYSSSHSLQVDLVVGEQNGREKCFALFTHQGRYPLTSKQLGDNITSYEAKYFLALDDIACDNQHTMPPQDLANAIKYYLEKGGVAKTLCNTEGCKKSLQDNIGRLTATAFKLTSPDKQKERWIDFLCL